MSESLFRVAACIFQPELWVWSCCQCRDSRSKILLLHLQPDFFVGSPTLIFPVPPGVGSLLARFQLTEGPSKPAPLAVQFTSEGSTLSGCDIELAGPGYRFSLVKKRFAAGQSSSMSTSHGVNPQISSCQVHTNTRTHRHGSRPCPTMSATMWKKYL